jgi:SpoIIAA-like
MVRFELNSSAGILIVEPEGALSAGDFGDLAATVDPYLEQNGDLRGLLLQAPAFPGWENFAALLSHLRFVREHHRRVRRVAVVSDSAFLSVAPKIANLFVSAELKTFGATDRAAALEWLGSA